MWYVRASIPTSEAGYFGMFISIIFCWTRRIIYFGYKNTLEQVWPYVLILCGLSPKLRNTEKVTNWFTGAIYVHGYDRLPAL